MLDGPFADRLDRFRLPHGTGGVVRRVHDDGLRALGACGLDGFDGWLEPAIGTGEHLDGYTAGQFHGLRIAGPERGRDNDLITLIEQNLEGCVYSLLTAIGDDNLAWIHLIAGITQGLAGDGLAQFGQARGGSVAIVLRILHRFGSSRHNGGRRCEIRFAGTEADNVDSGGFHSLCLGINGEGGAWRHMINTVG